MQTSYRENNFIWHDYCNDSSENFGESIGMTVNNGGFYELSEKTTVPVSFFYQNRIVETCGFVDRISDGKATIRLDIEEPMTLSPGTDLYIYMEDKGILYSVAESDTFPVITASRVSRRNHARVDDVLKMAYHPVDHEQYRQFTGNPQALFTRMFGETYKLPTIEDVDNETLYELLHQLNHKVDRLLEVLGGGETFHLCSATCEHINISASGMRFRTYEYYPVGAIIAIRLVLPLTMETPLNVLGEVVVSDGTVDEENRHSVSVKFINLTKGDEEIITRYVFKRQRELLRG
jgi:hypothetical protein